MKKVTYTIDDRTATTLRRAAARHRKPQSAIVREAVAQYRPDGDRRGEEERRRVLNVLDAYWASMPKRSNAAVEKELREIRASRRVGWRPGVPRRRR
jgi:hypothetical protein